MSILTGLFKNTNDKPQSTKAKEILAISDFVCGLVEKEQYIAKSQYLSFVKENKDLMEQLKTIVSNGLIEEYGKKNGITRQQIDRALDCYNNIEKLVDQHNEAYLEKQLVKEKNYLDGVLKDVDPAILLDDDQRRVVLADEDYTLVIAGAGAGKTTTVAAKVKYLVEKKKIDPKKILVISFTNKAVGELRERINEALKIDCPIATFHSTGNAIIHKHSPERLNIVEESKLYFVLQDYFRYSILNDESMVNNLINFFASYFDAPYEGNHLNEFFNKIAKGNYTTLKGDLDEYESEIVDSLSKKRITIQNEYVRSYQEVEIANFLYLNNIDYTYEPLYQYQIPGTYKPYTPDFYLWQGSKCCYLEHFGIGEDGTSNRYSAEQLEHYKQSVRDKISLHKKHNSNLIYTFSNYKDKKSLLTHLKDELVKAGFEIKPKNKKEVLEKLVSDESSRYIRKLVSLVVRFIGAFKTNNYTLDDFDRMYSSTVNVRTKLFINIAKQCYLEYERYLKESNSRDFQDLINESAMILRKVKEMKEKLDFEYIIVDEYQDISMQRYDLVTALSEVCDAKIIAVGDDWQSIYAFSGSDITLFTDFEKKVGYCLKQKIVNTYRNSQEVIDIAGNFIQKNDAQIKKALKSPKRINDPIIIRTYSGQFKEKKADQKSGIEYSRAKAVEQCIEDIIAYDALEGKKTKSILLLGRFGFDGEQLAWTGLFQMPDRSKSRMKSVRYPDIDITFMTAHASKGLGYDNVIIINGKNETYGFPAKIDDDPVLNLVLKNDRSIDYAEERRLFYVAMTRTKNRVYVVAPEDKPSEFLLEIKKDFENVKLIGNWDPNYQRTFDRKKTCPICGYPLMYRYKRAFGLRLYICTNEPEACGFLTNNIKGKKLSVQKCDCCKDGYLIVKQGNEEYFLGCTNYKKDSFGCNNSIGRKEFYAMNQYPWDKEELRIDRIKEENKAQKEEKKEKKKTEQKKVRPPKMQKEKELFFMVEEDESLKKVFIEQCQQYDLDQIVIIVLKELMEICSYRHFGVHTLTAALRGVKTKNAKAYHLESTAYFGALKMMKNNDLILIVNWLIAKGFINQTKSLYPLISIGYRANGYKENMTYKLLLELRREIVKYHEDLKEEA